MEFRLKRSPWVVVGAAPGGGAGQQHPDDDHGDDGDPDGGLDPEDLRPPEVIHGLDDGQQVRGAGMTFTALHTPGHTLGHVVYHDAASEIMFAGDHVLPLITPSIGWYRPQSSRPSVDLPDATRPITAYSGSMP